MELAYPFYHKPGSFYKHARLIGTFLKPKTRIFLYSIREPPNLLYMFSYKMSLLLCIVK